MRKHGWQLPCYPLQVVAVAVAVFIALGFAFYVFFAPFVGKPLYQFIIMGVYSLLIVGVFGFYIWSAAADPADPGVFRSKKYLKTSCKGEHTKVKDPKLGVESVSLKQNEDARGKGDKSLNEDVKNTFANTEDFEAEDELQVNSAHCSSCFWGIYSFLALSFANLCVHLKNLLKDKQVKMGCFTVAYVKLRFSSTANTVEFVINVLTVLITTAGNYRQFFTLMVIALLLLILQWSTGIHVIVCSFLGKKRFSAEIISKLGSSFSVLPFDIVVGGCTFLAILATLPLAQLFFFHMLLIKKGLSTYDYIVALREQEQQEVGGGQSPQMSQVSSLTGLSSASSFNNFGRGAWCTPPRLFHDDQFDVVPPDTGSVSSYGKKTAVDEPIKKKNPAVKIRLWALARLNAEEVSKAAAKARKKSKILQPVVRREGPLSLQRDSSFGSSGRRMVPRFDHSRRRNSKRIRLPTDLPLEQLVNVSSKSAKASTSLAPLQLEARSAFRTSLAVLSSANNNMVGSSPESSLDSPYVHPFHLSSSGAEESRRLTGLSVAGGAVLPGIPLSKSTSDGYEASGGEDSDQVPSRPEERPVNWSSLLFGSNPDGGIRSLKASSSMYSQGNNVRKL